MSKKKNKTLMGGWIERGMSRPLALGVFALSALVLVLLELTSRHTLSVDGVGRAGGISLSAPAIGVVSEVRVQQGQLVREGEVVLTIEAAEVRRQLDQVDADIRRTIRE
ncbi:MAG: biotin/lipoyl-binding protein, partial [Sandaracinaceae bacterium]|nr:biotin/lipoyl-binding protein [Sandaracinaceae bacterium]